MQSGMHKNRGYPQQDVKPGKQGVRSEEVLFHAGQKVSGHIIAIFWNGEINVVEKVEMTW